MHIEEKDIFTLTPSEIVKWCQEQKDALGYSNAKISELSGVPVGTVDRIMAGKYSEYKYSSIQPMVACLLGYGEDTPEPDNSIENDYYYNTINGYKLVLERKNKEIEHLRSDNEMLRSARDYLKAEIDRKEENIKFLQELILDLRSNR